MSIPKFFECDQGMRERKKLWHFFGPLDHKDARVVFERLIEFVKKKSRTETIQVEMIERFLRSSIDVKIAESWRSDTLPSPPSRGGPFDE